MKSIVVEMHSNLSKLSTIVQCVHFIVQCARSVD